MAKDTGRHYPANARSRRRWTWAVGVPVGAALALGGVLLYQQVFGTDSTDPLTVNTQARSAMINLPPPEGWTRGDVRTVCPKGSADVRAAVRDAENCGGGFLQIGVTTSDWVAPAAAKGATRTEAADADCEQLAAHLAARSSAPRVRVTDCRRALLASSKQPSEVPVVVSWSNPSGDWTIVAGALSDPAAPEDPRRFVVGVALQPVV